MASGFGGQPSGGGGGSVWGSIITGLIGAASTWYAGEQASDAQKESDDRIAAANKVAQDRADKAMLDAEARAEEQRAIQATADAEAAVPVGESATLDFNTSMDKTTGSSIDFLVPKLGATQLSSNGSSTGLGV